MPLKNFTVDMNQAQRRNDLIKYLLAEQDMEAKIPKDESSQRLLLRALFNVRPPRAADDGFLRIQDEYLREELRLKGITKIADLTPVQPDIYLWRGDITTLQCDGIVNAANPKMLGCFCPNHTCIDNAVHTFAGVQLRQECAELMKAQGHDEPAGGAKLTKGYNLPCKYVLHTVGPIVYGALDAGHERLLESCYRACLALAEQHGLESLAFCCISTGEFRFPNGRAAEIAVSTVQNHKRQTGSKIKVVFDVFKEQDHALYARLLGADW